MIIFNIQTLRELRCQNRQIFWFTVYRVWVPMGPITILSDTQDSFESQCSDWAMQQWAKNGVDRSKLLMGIAAYGRGMVLADPEQNGLYAPTTAPIGPALNTSAHKRGYWPYNEYCERMTLEPNQWTLFRVGKFHPSLRDASRACPMRKACFESNLVCKQV